MSATTRFWLVFPLLSLVLALSVSDPQARAGEAGSSPHVPISDVRVRLSDHGPVVLLSADG
ncbi:MAG: uncharacterized protein QG615_341, partial [Nitrospirota bacterium]|nr:uncharacterized protein [Nitrospirota bacterium]